MAQILDGKILSEELAPALKKKAESLAVKPKLIIIQIGSLGESNTYIRKKKDFGKELGVLVEHKKYPESIEEEAVVKDIKQWNADPSVHGIMIQLPIPSRLDTKALLDTVDEEKDVDGLTSVSASNLQKSNKGFLPAVTRAVIELLKYNKIRVSKKKVAVIGDSPWFGRPTALALSNLGASVVVCNKETENLQAATKSADIIISAVGKPGLITAEHVSKGQVVVDIGTTVKNGKVFGDVDYESVEGIVSAITPVPGGVGPMTVLSLFENLIESCSKLSNPNKKL